MGAVARALLALPWSASRTSQPCPQGQVPFDNPTALLSTSYILDRSTSWTTGAHVHQGHACQSARGPSRYSQPYCALLAACHVSRHARHSPTQPTCMAAMPCAMPYTMNTWGAGGSTTQVCQSLHPSIPGSIPRRLRCIATSAGVCMVARRVTQRSQLRVLSLCDDPGALGSYTGPYMLG